MGRLDGKVAIVTGAASGMGKETAILFAKEGAKIAAADWTVEDGEKTVELINKAGGEAIFIKTDVSKVEEVKNMVKKTVDNFKKINILMNIAGITAEEGSIVDCTEETFYKVISINLLGTWMSMKYAIPEIEKAGGGSIVNFTSVAALEAYKSMPAYAASKGGVITVSRVAAIESASKNIRVNCIAPGHIATPMFLGCWSEEQLEALGPKIVPLGRLGKPEEIAKVALFLASDEASYITATTIVADGGLTARIP
jgi:NAD(P)-dependent dehydrogenase (short-subunit alcohol dehydrogenase family)